MRDQHSVVAVFATALLDTLALAMLALATLAPATLADQPLPAPQDKTVCAPNGLFCARMDLAANEIRVTSEDQLHWRMPGWFRDAYLADDGDHLVVGYGGLSLLDRDYRPQTTMITFWRRGRIVRRVPLSEVIAAPARLRPTVSHVVWGQTVGFDEAGRFVVHTAEHRRIAFDVATGLILETRPAPYPY